MKGKTRIISRLKPNETPHKLKPLLAKYRNGLNTIFINHQNAVDHA